MKTRKPHLFIRFLKEAFSLRKVIEIGTIIVVVAIIASSAVPAYMNILYDAKDNTARSILGVIRSVVSFSFTNSAALGTPAYPKFTGALFEGGMIPFDPFVGSSGVLITKESPITIFTDVGGYIYNETTGEVRMNVSGRHLY